MRNECAIKQSFIQHIDHIHSFFTGGFTEVTDRQYGCLMEGPSSLQSLIPEISVFKCFLAQPSLPKTVLLIETDRCPDGLATVPPVDTGPW
jgi:hypothetical protein